MASSHKQVVLLLILYIQCLRLCKVVVASLSKRAATEESYNTVLL